MDVIVVWDGRRDGANRGHLCLTADPVRLAGDPSSAVNDLPDFRHLLARPEKLTREPHKSWVVRDAVESHWSTLATIAERSSLSERTTRIRLRALIDEGVVERAEFPADPEKHKSRRLQYAAYRRKRSA